MRRFNVHLVTEIDFVDGATKRQTRRRRITRSISQTPVGTRRKGSRFGRSKTKGWKASRSQKSGMNSKRGFEPMTLANMRLNGIHMVIASCANCGRSADVNVDLLPETLRSANGYAAAAAAVTQSRPAPLGIRARGRAILTIGANGRRCPRPPLRRPP
jgi:hypothetical protein